MKSYLKFLSRNKLYTAIEAVGLAVSLAFVILIGSYVVQQYEVAHESPQWKRTFVLGSDQFLGLTYWDKEELEMNIPEVEAATHVAVLWQPVIQKGEEPVQASGIEADADFFKVFPEYHLLEGSRRPESRPMPTSSRSSRNIISWKEAWRTLSARRTSLSVYPWPGR